MTIGFGKDLQTSQVSAYSWGWCKAYAKAFKEFVETLNEDRCVHCLPQGEGKQVYARREAVRRCAEVVGLDSSIDDFTLDFGEDRGEVFVKAHAEPSLKAGIAETRGSHLGARCCAGSAVCVTSPFEKN